MIIEMSGDTFAKNLVYLRKKYGLSRRTLGKLVGISPLALENIEKGINRPAVRLEVFQRLCEVFHLDSDTLAQINLSTFNAK